MNNNKTTRAAKFSGLLAGLAVWTLILMALPLLGIVIVLVSGIGVLEIGIFIILSITLLFLLGPILATFIGSFINLRWDSYSKSKKYLLNIIYSFPVLALLFIMASGDNSDRENERKSSNYKNANMHGSHLKYSEIDQICEQHWKEGRPLENPKNFLKKKEEPIDSFKGINKE